MIRVLAVIFLIAGCSLVSEQGRRERRADEAAMSRADDLSAAGRYSEAADVYRGVSDSGATEELRARALFELARLAIEPQNPERESLRASEYLDRLRREFSSSRWGVYARSWQYTLDELRRMRGESASREQEILELRQQLHELTGGVTRTRDAARELERLRQRLADAEREIANMREALQRLKALEMELDQRGRQR